MAPHPGRQRPAACSAGCWGLCRAAACALPAQAAQLSGAKPTACVPPACACVPPAKMPVFHLRKCLCHHLCVPVSPTSTCCRVKQENPGIARLLEQPQLAANELATRLFYFYSAQDQPLLSEQQLAALAAEGADGQAAAREGDDWVAPVPADLKRQLNHYRDMACLAYDYNTGRAGLWAEKHCRPWAEHGRGARSALPCRAPAVDRPASAELRTAGGVLLPCSARARLALPLLPADETLREQLAERGFTLLCASYVADLDSGCPAYFLCIRQGQHSRAQHSKVRHGGGAADATSAAGCLLGALPEGCAPFMGSSRPPAPPLLLCRCCLWCPSPLPWLAPWCSEDEGEVALVIRGTFSAEDAFFDLLANGAPEQPSHAPSVPGGAPLLPAAAANDAAAGTWRQPCASNAVGGPWNQLSAAAKWQRRLG